MYKIMLIAFVAIATLALGTAFENFVNSQNTLIAPVQTANQNLSFF